MYFIKLVYDWLFTVYEVAIRREYIVSMEFILENIMNKIKNI